MTPTSRRPLALALALSLTILPLAVPAARADQTLFQGRVLQKDGITPRHGVVIALVDTETREIFRSSRTGEEGAFRIANAPAGPYAVVAETDAGAFLAAEYVQLTNGENRPLALILRPAEPSRVIAPGKAGAPGTGLADKVWWQWLVGGAIVVIALWAIDDATKSSETTATSF